jgi:hypothetical protein
MIRANRYGIWERKKALPHRMFLISAGTIRSLPCEFSEFALCGLSEIMLRRHPIASLQLLAIHMTS